MSRKRRNHSPDFKSKVAVAAPAPRSGAWKQPELEPYITEGRTPQWVADTGIVRDE
jgi:hypothetical protein